MFDELARLHQRPEVFSVYTADTLWTQPHLADQMLRLHLDQETALASRPLQAIDRFVGWLDQSIGLEGKAVCDLGCGPGLYASRCAERGALVRGLDFSPTSIDYAKGQQETAKAPITFEVADYLTGSLPECQDLIMLIYCDLCALSPAQRQTLLGKVQKALSPGGHFIFDVFSRQAFSDIRDGVAFGKNHMDGFWSAADYFAFQHTFRYDTEAVSLDRYTVIEAERTWEVYNWLQYFSPETIRAELESAGFDTVEMTDGFGMDPSDPNTFGVIARS